MNYEKWETWTKGTRVAMILISQGKTEVLANFEIPKTADVHEYLRAHRFSLKYNIST